ncbi:hypothetical protein [Streptomyces sp. NPDC056304]|uniref:hypothetical protein n=1 Tax=Streptomyces sp. NPDC056304 TaxID=3345778 RepID=UPI0035DA91E8
MSRISKARIVAASGVAALAITTPLALAGEAQAAGGTAPACVSRSVDTSARIAYLANLCSKTMKITVVYTDGSQSPCFTMQDGATLEWRYGLKTYARTAVC